MPDHVLETIKERLSLADVIRSSGHPLISKGRAWRGPCPFEEGASKRSEKFMVDGDHYYCHGCTERGDVLTWLQKREHLTFMDAVEEAAGRIGLDLTPYKRKNLQADSPAERRRTAALEALATLSTLARETAEAAAAADSSIAYEGVPMCDLVARGEVGLFPAAGRTATHLQALGIGAEACADIGWTPAVAAAAAGRWVLWARKHDRILGGRPVGGWDGVIGPYGERSTAWVMAPASGNRPLEAPATIAADDVTYLALRAANVVAVIRPLSKATLRDRLPATLTLRDKPPVVVVRPTNEARRSALGDTLPLLGPNPRVRVVEADPAGVPGLTSADWTGRLERLVMRAGTVIDWQIRLLARHPSTETAEGRVLAAKRLANIVNAVESPLERAAYQAEAEAVTGVVLSEVPKRGHSAVRR